MYFYYHPILGLQLTFNKNTIVIKLENKPPELAKKYKQVIKRTQTNL